MTDDQNSGDPEATVEPDLDRIDAPLAVIVEKPRVETAIESLRTEGVYDDSRRVREEASTAEDSEDATTARAGGDREDGERVALPVTEPPTETRVLEVVRQIDPDRRTTDLADRLAERGWDEAALETVPGSWAVIGSVILVSVPEDCPDERELGEALLEHHGEADSVLADCGIATDGDAGTYREPRTRLLAGEADTETIHTEHGTRYALDPSRVMFSPGNQAERVRMGETVEPGERVFDMFAGIGYFTLPMARAGADVTAAEINPTAFRYLLENAVLNGVEERIDAYRADCRAVADGVADSGGADRIVMGYYGSGGSEGGDGGGTERTAAAHTYLDDALRALAPDGVVHYHEATPESELRDRPEKRLESAVSRAGRELEILERRRVKSHSPGVVHVVLDARVE
ncbi:class I SAM-dependent methyltransferase family protein [Saliphagus sp. LR7]|uniref:class I SAM-dependent methyltransferase n=1 Tax=Saliphagus sp. LR7 TaxID=2282654 RepID=UPI000DF73B51|nr:class I SAM-dependent methyltransferase family protein [Saliphagus sp. LR7]